jgi:hypothetical protein
MGAWDTGAFDNDDASDWVYELEDGGIDAIESALDDAVRSDDLSAPTDVIAIAAAEVVAAAIGQPVPGLREDIAALVPSVAPNVTPEHVSRARTAAERVLDASELAERWAETDDTDEWRGLVEDLMRRLSVPALPVEPPVMEPSAPDRPEETDSR